ARIDRGPVCAFVCDRPRYRTNSPSLRSGSRRYCESSITPSELELQSVLHDAWVHAHCSDFSERARARDIARRIGKVRAINEIEYLPAENDAGLLAEFCALDDSHVHVALVRPSESIPSYI